MFKKIKENEKVQKIIELWKNPKTHDLIVLAFWLIFIFIVIIFARSVASPNVKNVDVKAYTNSFEYINNYDFTYESLDYKVHGSYYDDKLVFYLDNKRYYYHENTYLIGKEATLVPNYDLGILKINPKMLNNLVGGITPSENGEFKQYSVPLDRFINLYEIDTDVDLSKAATYNVVIKVYLVDNEISKVILDLSNYYLMKGNLINNPVTIYYYNVNNIRDFSKGYDKLLEVKEWQFNY